MDPVTAAFNAVTAIALTADQIFKLVGRLSDHGRTLDQAEADRRHASARLDDDGAPPAKE